MACLKVDSPFLDVIDIHLMILTGLLGWPVGHSRSPAMHNAAFAASGTDGVYVPLAVPPERLGTAVMGLAALGFSGTNVTIPHKRAVMAYVHELSPAAVAIGAVNTLVVRLDGSLYGDNTDASGFLADLSDQGLDMDVLATSGALVLGAGGSARAVAYALASRGIPVVVSSRRSEQAHELVAALQRHLLSAPQASALLKAQPWSSLPVIAGLVSLVVNCTPLGMTPDVGASPWPDGLAFQPAQIAYDLVYNPPHTRFMSQARASGAQAINGLGMLLHQGALAWEAWTGQPAPLATMREALSRPTADH